MDHDADRIRRHTAGEVLRRIDDVTVASLSRCAESPAGTQQRLDRLDREWDTDRALEVEAATMGLIGLALGVFVRPQLLALPAALDREWDVEHLLQANASPIVLLGLALAATVSRRFVALPAGVFGFFAQHALQGWCPPIPVFRRLGVRTQREIERERYALKALRGDFDGVAAHDDAPAGERIRAALAAVDK